MKEKTEQVLMELSKRHRSAVKNIADDRRITQISIFRTFCDLIEGLKGNISIVVCDSTQMRVSEDFHEILYFDDPKIIKASFLCLLNTDDEGMHHIQVNRSIVENK